MFLGNLTPPEYRRKINVACGIYFFEERRGGVAAIDPPPQDGNATQLAEWREGLRARNGREKN